MVNMRTGKMNLNQLALQGSAVAEAQATITLADVIIHTHYKYFHKNKIKLNTHGVLGFRVFGF